MALALFGSVAFICLSSMFMFSLWMEWSRDNRDVAKLSSLLEAKLKSMEDMKARMETLLLKNGLGR